MSGRLLNNLVVACMAASIAAMLQPWWSDGFRLGFFALIASTAAQIVVSHVWPLASEK